MDTEGAEVVHPITAFWLSTTSVWALIKPSKYTFWPVMFSVDVVERTPELVMFTVAPERLRSPAVVMLPDTTKSPVLYTANFEKSKTESITIALVRTVTAPITSAFLPKVVVKEVVMSVVVVIILPRMAAYALVMEKVGACNVPLTVTSPPFKETVVELSTPDIVIKLQSE